MYRKEYPIRCKSCNEQLACYAEEYEILAKEFDPEKALNILQIMEPCSRLNMMNPMIILNIKENRNLIEGLEDIDVIDKFSENLSFQKCEYRSANSNYNLSKKKQEIKSEKDLTQKLPITNVTGKQIIQKQTYLPSINTIRPTLVSPNVRSGVTVSLTKTSPIIPSNKPLVIIPKQPSSIMSPAQQVRASIMSPAQQVRASINSNLLDPIQIEPDQETENDFVKIRKSVEEKEKEFQYPTVVGIPTINPSSENTKIHISGKYYAEVLSGRTYICR